MSKQALGRGFDGLIPTGFDVSTVAEPGESIKQIALSKLQPNPDQPRKTFDAAALNELAASLTQHGVIQPLVVTPAEKGYRIIAGERRYRAAKIAKLTKVPVVVRNHKELEELEIALVENVQRVDLSPLETAVSIVRLRDQFSLTPKQISQKLGKAETTISNITRLLQLPREAITALQNGSITEGHARAILALRTDQKLQNELLNNIVTHSLSVREAEDFVKKHKKVKTKNAVNSDMQKRLSMIEEKLHVKTTVSHSKNGGSITISYNDTTQLESIVDTFIENL